jgi:hypothetical protein
VLNLCHEVVQGDAAVLGDESSHCSKCFRSWRKVTTPAHLKTL